LICACTGALPSAVTPGLIRRLCTNRETPIVLARQAQLPRAEVRADAFGRAAGSAALPQPVSLGAWVWAPDEEPRAEALIVHRERRSGIRGTRADAFARCGPHEAVPVVRLHVGDHLDEADRAAVDARERHDRQRRAVSRQRNAGRTRPAAVTVEADRGDPCSRWGAVPVAAVATPAATAATTIRSRFISLPPLLEFAQHEPRRAGPSSQGTPNVVMRSHGFSPLHRHELRPVRSVVSAAQEPLNGPVPRLLVRELGSA
jgi:hypothetical protein